MALSKKELNKIKELEDEIKRLDWRLRRQEKILYDKNTEINEYLSKYNSFQQKIESEFTILKNSKEIESKFLYENSRSNLHTITIFSFILILSLTILNSIIINRLDKFQIKIKDGKEIIEKTYDGNAINTIISFSYAYALLGFFTIFIVSKLFDSLWKFKDKKILTTITIIFVNLSIIWIAILLYLLFIK